MKLVFSRQALADLEEIAGYYTVSSRAPRIAAAVEQRIKEVVDRIARAPQSAQRLAQRREVRMAPLLRYPYKIFYRPRADVIEIPHIRHTSRRPWEGER